MKSEMLYVWAEPTNPFFDPDKSIDGGGYWQYQGMAFYIIDGKEGISVNVSDESCGILGARLRARISTNKYVFDLHWGNMDGLKPLSEQGDIIKEFKLKTGFALTTLLAMAFYDVSQEAARKCSKHTITNFSQNEIECHIVKLRSTRCKESKPGDIEALMDFSAE